MKKQTLSDKIEELKAEIRQARDNRMFGIAQQAQEELNNLAGEELS